MSDRINDMLWWTINGQSLMDALHAAHDGDDPNIVYLELLTNSDDEEAGQ